MYKILHTLPGQKSPIRDSLGERDLGWFTAFGADLFQALDMVIEGSAFDTADKAGGLYGIGEDKDKGGNIFGPDEMAEGPDCALADILEGEGFVLDWSFPLVE